MPRHQSHTERPSLFPKGSAPSVVKCPLDRRDLVLVPGMAVLFSSPRIGCKFSFFTWGSVGGERGHAGFVRFCFFTSEVLLVGAGSAAREHHAFGADTGETLMLGGVRIETRDMDVKHIPHSHSILSRVQLGTFFHSCPSLKVLRSHCLALWDMTVFHLRLLCGAVDPSPSAPRLLVPSVRACSLSLPTSQQGRRKQVRREQFTSQIKYVLVPLMWKLFLEKR